MSKSKIKLKKEFLELDIDEIIINPKNPRRHNKLNVNMIKKSIGKVGFIDEIVIDENNVILAGHGRLLALQELGEKKAEVKKVYGLTDEQKKQYLVYSNRTTETSGWDGEVLFSIVDELLENDKDFLVGDFEMEELVNAYKIDEINEISEAEKIGKGQEVFIAGIFYTKENQAISDYIENLKTLQQGNEDVEIFTGKEIPTPKSKL